MSRQYGVPAGLEPPVAAGCNGRVSRNYEHETTEAPASCPRVVVTFPIHPLRGMALPVVRLGNGPIGHRTIDVEHPEGGTLRLPEQWTDQGLPLVQNGESAKSTPEHLRALARLVAAIGGALNA